MYESLSIDGGPMVEELHACKPHDVSHLWANSHLKLEVLGVGNLWMMGIGGQLYRLCYE